MRSTLYGSFYVRCRLYDCHGYGGVARYGLFSGCYIDPSTTIGKGRSGASANGVFGNECKSLHCTGPALSFFSDANQNHFAGVFGSSAARSAGLYWGSVFSPEASADYASCDKAKLCFVDPGAKDYRLFGNTPATHAGVYPERGTSAWTSWANRYQWMVSSDADGNPIHFNANGNPMPGCYQKPPVGVFADFDGTSVVIEGAQPGGTVLEEGGGVAFSRSAKPARNVTAVVFNGETNLFAQVPTVSFSYADVAAVGGLYVTEVANPHWYVNPDGTVGDDANDGFTPETPKRTLAGVMSGPGLLAGDTVHAAAGVYDEETMSAVGGKKLEVLSRASVPAGVTLVSDEGADRTFIIGAASTAADKDAYGCGEGAVRCLTLGTGARVRGFTLAGGRTRSGDFNTYSTYNEGVGGCVYGDVRSDLDSVTKTLVEDCVVSNGVASVGGAGYNVTFVRSRLFRCRAVRGAATERCGLVNSIVDDMDSSGSTGIGINDCFKVVNCTIGGDFRKSAGYGVAFYRQWGNDYGVTNTLCLGSTHAIISGTACNCAFATDSKAGVDCIQVTVAQCALDADYRPDQATSMLVDRGLTSAAEGEADAWGGQRIYNGRVDIGAVEADWRARYAADISGRRRFVVTDATPNVTETADATVSVGAGGSLAAVWKGVAGKAIDYTVSVKVSGTGVAKIGLGTDVREVSPSADVQTLTFTGAEAANRLVCDNSGNDGAVEILGSKRILGALLIVR